jgi:hypothetical protein
VFHIVPHSNASGASGLSARDNYLSHYASKACDLKVSLNQKLSNGLFAAHFLDIED